MDMTICLQIAMHMEFGTNDSLQGIPHSVLVDGEVDNNSLVRAKYGGTHRII